MSDGVLATGRPSDPPGSQADIGAVHWRRRMLIVIGMFLAVAGCGRTVRGSAGHAAPPGEARASIPASTGAQAPLTGVRAATGAPAALGVVDRSVVSGPAPRTGGDARMSSLEPSPSPGVDHAGAAAPSPLAAAPLSSGEEEGDNPRSELVIVKVLVEPPKIAHVFWGSKDLGLAPLEIQRPRSSGPLDLVLRAPGYLTLHTRAFTDRDDRVAARLVPETDAPRMFGYRSRP